MCGILGGNDVAWNYEKGIESLHHRGPDAHKIKEKSGFTMAFARLSIMDLSDRGMQPMASPDGNVLMVYNGEIYDYGNLKRDLEKKYIFRSTSDSEVILYTYLEYGDQFIDKIDGMFAIAILDIRDMKLRLFRDRAGIKPLYYYCKDGTFAFASELKALLAASVNVAWAVDYTAIYDYLFYQYIPEPKSMYKDCCKLLPAHELIFDLVEKRIISIEEYWKLEVNASRGIQREENALQEELRHLVHESVRAELVADVPVGTYLSGGVDSSIITYEADQLQPQINAFTIGFDEFRYDESQYARMLVQHFGLNSRLRVLSSKEVANVKPLLRSWYDEPFADNSAYPTYIVSKLAKEYVTTVLTGDGGDEIFGGYERYARYDDAMAKKRWDSNVISHWAEKLGFKDLFSGTQYMRYFNSGLDEYLPDIFFFDPRRVKKYQERWAIPKEYDPTWYVKQHYHKDLPPLTRIRYLDFKTYLPSDILTKVDRVSMANSLECRVPYLSRAIIEFAFSLSEEECCTTQNLKKVLKNAYKRLLPHDILFRKKMGFGVPPKYLHATRRNVPFSVSVLQHNWRDLV